jgi:hypothetical protein
MPLTLLLPTSKSQTLLPTSKSQTLLLRQHSYN